MARPRRHGGWLTGTFTGHRYRHMLSVLASPNRPGRGRPSDIARLFPQVSPALVSTVASMVWCFPPTLIQCLAMGGHFSNRPGRNAWHQSFAELVSKQAPADAEVHSEVELSRQPSRVDLVLIRRREHPWRTDESGILSGMWPLLSRVTLVDFKSPSHQLRAPEMARLVGYGWQYFEKHWAELAGPEVLTLALVAPRNNAGLSQAVDKLGWSYIPHDNGYGRIEGVGFGLVTAFTDDICEAEADEFLRIFSHHPVRDPKAIDWLQDWIFMKEHTMPALKRSRSFQEVRQKLLDSMTPEERMAGLAPEERLVGLDHEGLTRALAMAGLDPEERMAGLAPEERLVGLDHEGLTRALAGLDRESLVRALAQWPAAERERVIQALVSAKSRAD